MQILNIGGQQYAIGIDWQQHASAAAAKAALKGVAFNRIAGMTTPAGEYIQGAVQTDVKGPLHAAAIVASCIHQAAIIRVNLPDSSVWVCGISDGQPLAGTDIIIEQSEAAGTVTQISSFVKGAVLIGDHPARREGEATQTLPIAEAFAAVTQGDLEQAEFSSRFEISKRTLLIAGFSAAAALSIWGGYQVFQSYTDQQAIEAAELAQQQAQVAEAMRMANYHALIAKQENELIIAPKPYQQFAIWKQAIDVLPLSVSGWSPTEANCAANQCQIEWRRHPQALPSDSKELPGQLVSAEQDVAVTHVDLASADNYAATDTEIELQTYLVDLVAVVPNFVARRATDDVMAALPPEMMDLPPVVIGKAGGFEVSASNLLLMQYVVEKLNYPGVRLGAVKISGISAATTSMRVEVEGSYVVRAR